MNLDVIVPTYNRAHLLERTLASLLRAPIPRGLNVSILIIDNNSSDDTHQLVADLQSQHPSVLYIKETKQGLSHARNAGIAAGDGELLGFIDDDEEIAPDWFEVVAREFTDPDTAFIGGPYLANCTVPFPAWLPSEYNGVIGIIAAKPRALFTPAFPGNLNGGNAVLRRSVFDQVGLYDVYLGRSGKGLLSEEDAELYRRLLDAGLRGFHVPELAIYHHIPAARLTRTYYRRWVFWRGLSHGIADRQRPEPVTYLFGVPRYRCRQALAGLLALPRNLSAHQGSPAAFTRELPLWDLLGFVRGKYFTRIRSFYGEVKTRPPNTPTT